MTGCLLPPGQLSEHDAPPLHEMEHEPLQVTSQLAPAVHEALPEAPSVMMQCEPSQVTLPLGPVPMLQVLPPEQVALQESLHEPLHEAPLVHWSEQLPPPLVQLVLLAQVQLGPGHGPPAPLGPELPLEQAASKVKIESKTPVVRAITVMGLLAYGEVPFQEACPAGVARISDANAAVDRDRIDPGDRSDPPCVSRSRPRHG